MREIVQAETAGAAPAVVGAVEAREGDGEEGSAVGLVSQMAALQEPARISFVGVFSRGCRLRSKSPAGLEGEQVGVRRSATWLE